MKKIEAEIVADSINQQGDRLTSLVLTYPRIIHAEMMTHRMFSRNASSSRAVPVKKMIESVRNNTFCPIEFQKAHKGMQGSEYFVGSDKQDYINLWLESAELALEQAEKMDKKGISKQIINRILEPYQYYTVLITGSQESWDNFFELRNPVYETEIGVFKSKRDALISYAEGGVMANLPTTDLEWMQVNKGQAEIHIMDLSEKIYNAMNESTPEQLNPGEWHIPMLSEEDKELPIDLQLKYAVGVHANTSYTVVGDGRKLTLPHAIKIHDKCKEEVHSSVFEHCARAMSDEEYVKFRKGETFEDTSVDISSLGWCNNFKGFIQYRYLIENDYEQ